MTWHCIGTTSIMVGMIRFSGFCLATDPAGDQIVADVVSDGTFPVTERNRPAKGVFTSGTGKLLALPAPSPTCCIRQISGLQSRE
jgi:hypothetical protein